MRSRRPDSFFDMTDAEIDERNAARVRSNERRTELRTIAQRGGWRGEVARQIEEGILPTSALWNLAMDFEAIAAEERRQNPHLRFPLGNG